MEVPRSDLPAPRAAAPRVLLLIAAGAAVLMVLCMVALDEPVARWAATFEPETGWTRVIEKLEWLVLLPPFRWLGPVVLALGMLIAVAVPRWRGAAPAWMFMTATHLLGQLATNYLKMWTGRLRPTEWLANGGGDSFGWVTGFSFPSGHVAIFGSAIIPFVVLVPRAWPLLAIVAYAMVARVAVNAHFLSDVVGAIALICVLTWIFGWLIRPLRPSASTPARSP